MQRSDWVDNAKGIGIILVIFGHIYTGYVKEFIFLFHMPFFFLLSGMLLSGKPTSFFFSKKLKGLLPTYLTYGLLFLAFEIFKTIINHEFSFKLAAIMIIKGVLGGQWLTGVQGVFWFIPVFFISQQILYQSITRLSEKKRFFLFSSMLIAAYIDSYYFRFKTPLNISACLYGAPMMYIGYNLKNIKSFPQVNLLLISLSAFILYLYPDIIYFDMKYNQYGLPFVNIAISIAFFLFIKDLAKVLSNKAAIISLFGVASLHIMYIHQFIRIELSNRITNESFYTFIITCVVSYLYVMTLNEFKKQKNKLAL